MSGAPIRIGYVHVGPRQHGVTRYGHLLAAAARAHPDLAVSELRIELTGGRFGTFAALRRAATELADVDVVHLQYNNQLTKSVWGSNWAQIRRLWGLTVGVGAPVVATVHDVPERPRWPGWRRSALAKLQVAVRRASRKLPRMLHSPDSLDPRDRSCVGSIAGRNLRPDALALWWLHRRAQVLLVCSDEERRRLQDFVPDARVQVIPHFVESRSLGTDAEAAKAALGLAGRRVVTLLGYIHPRKGHMLLIDALPAIPPDVTLVFAGAAEADHLPYLEQLLARARSTGLAERVRVTGYLGDRELDTYLAASDLAVCPFSSVSASGSISTWIAAGTPILASDLPLIAEYNRLAPGAIRTFRPYTANALAQAVCTLLQHRPTDGGESLHRLRSRLSIHSTLQRHIALYREVCGQRAAEPGSSHPAPVRARHGAGEVQRHEL
jgi:glycosyltransferase involved in cell wall biosynthesis